MSTYNYSFLWSRNENERRLFLFHADRPKYQTITSVCGSPLELEGPLFEKWPRVGLREPGGWSSAPTVSARRVDPTYP